jgi:hypothetical protein
MFRRGLAPIVGYHMLLVAVIAFYFLAMVLRGRAKLVTS